MKGKTPKLPLTPEERQILRRHKIRLSEMAALPADELAHLLGCTEERAQRLAALAQFQTVPSIGPDLANDVADLGYLTLAELKGKNPADLFDRLEQLRRTRIDPCVEDALRLMVYYAENADSDKRWWDFTEERKRYRRRHGYPKARPVR